MLVLTASWKMVYVTIIDSVKIDKIFSKIIDSRLPFRFRNPLTGRVQSQNIFFTSLSLCQWNARLENSLIWNIDNI